MNFAENPLANVLLEHNPTIEPYYLQQILFQVMFKNSMAGQLYQPLENVKTMSTCLLYETYHLA